MSLRRLVEGDCGGANPLMQLGGQFLHDAARKDEGFVQAEFERNAQQSSSNHLVDEFLGQIAAPPQSFQMQSLLEEMHEIEQRTNNLQMQIQAAPRVIDEVNTAQWTQEFGMQGPQTNVNCIGVGQIVHVVPKQQEMTEVREFFDVGPKYDANSTQPLPPSHYMSMVPPYKTYTNLGPEISATEKFFEENYGSEQNPATMSHTHETMENWLNDYQKSAYESEELSSNYSDRFWKRLQDEWNKLSEDSEYPWLSDINDVYDPYKEYDFIEENPMNDVEDAFAQGKAYLEKGDLPSAVLCFESAAKKNPEDAKIWEVLGITQAENEMDPQCIAALKRSLAIDPNNPRAIMAIAISFTNESLQSHALRMLVKWIEIHPQHKNLLAKYPNLTSDVNDTQLGAPFRNNKLKQVQDLYLDAVRQDPNNIDSDVQEALGVLYNLSSEFDKAVDCFRVALHHNPGSAKIWNRLGASLANGSRSVEAVEAYQNALAIEPGFIRVRYNVGVCCMNLKAYKQAAEHLLVALNMQANSEALGKLEANTGDAGAIHFGQSKMSNTIWSTLKMVISLMGRNDLHGHVADRNLDALNEAFRE